MDDTVSLVMDERLAELFATWRRTIFALDVDPLELFTPHRDHLLIVDGEGGQSCYTHYGRAFVEKFGADLTGSIIDALPSEILPADRRGMIAFEYAFVRQTGRPLWRSYTATFETGLVETWQRLALPVGGDRLVICAYPCARAAEKPDTTTAEGLLRLMIERVPVVLDSDGRVVDLALSLRDFSDARQHAAELEVLASLDPLTNVANLRHFHDLSALELAHARRMGRPFALLALDIDHFKRINDTHGHATGDLALKAFVAACRKALRDLDILGRCGGEEFAVALPNTNADGALVIAERLRSQVESLRVDLPTGGSVNLTVSIGVACSTLSDGDGATVTDLLERADAALYRSKREGRNRVTLESAGQPDDQGEQQNGDGLHAHPKVH